MVIPSTPEPEEIGAPERACAQCGHADSEHVEQDYEVAGNTIRRIFCEPCDDWHDFVADPDDV